MLFHAFLSVLIKLLDGLLDSSFFRIKSFFSLAFGAKLKNLNMHLAILRNSNKIEQ